MRYLAAYLLATLGGKTNPSKNDVTKILESVGLEIEEDRLDKVMSELKGKDIKTVMAEGMGKLAAIPSGGVAVASSGAPTSGGGGAEEKEEEKKEEKEESANESDDDMGFGLFD